MPERPTITVQLIHIEGPLKGNIEETTDDVLHIGRYTDCEIQFPKEATIVSRHHAEIVRDGNRFKIVDHSTNGTFLNGKAVKEATLKNGDVLMIGDGGPKFSFLSEMQTGPPPPVFQNFDPETTQMPASKRREADAEPGPKHSPNENRVAPMGLAKPTPNSHAADIRVQAPLAIQFGPTIQSFKVLPVVIGKRADCDFIINYPNIIDRHAQVFFHEANYWIKDLTGQQMITVNDMPVREQTPLNPGSQLSLSPQGPVFQFLSGGRLAEASDQPASGGLGANSPAPQHPPIGAVSSPSRQGKNLLMMFIGILLILVIAGVLFFIITNTLDQAVFSDLKGRWLQLVNALRELI